MQYFHWYVPDDGTFWNQAGQAGTDLARAGFTALWLPPAYKGIAGPRDVGYGVYDLYDLGEFDQKGALRTKYGTRDGYLAALQTLRAAGIQTYADTVLNHRMGAEETELARATPYRQHDRLYPAGPPREVRTYTRYDFKPRAGRYSDFVWSWRHFDAVDYDDLTREPGMVYLFEGKQFDDQVALELGNFSYLMGSDLDFQNPDVRAEITNWGKWYLDTTGVDGFRLDAIKHISAWFFPEWLDTMERHVGRDLFVVGEYWTPDLNTLKWYLDAVGSRMSVFDVSLHFNFHFASRAGRDYDLRKILDGTLMRERPWQAVTFVDNHDSQPLQALESCVEPWFKPLAYALILLRSEGYPCVFYPDYYGAEYEDRGRDGKTYQIVLPSHKRLLDLFLQARRAYNFGPTYDYFDHPHMIGWTRPGDRQRPKAMAVLIASGPGGEKWMEVGLPDATFRDLTGHVKETVTANEHGWAPFRCAGGSVSVWVSG